MTATNSYLIIDDQEITRTRLHQMIRRNSGKENIKIMEAENLSAAKALIFDCPPDLILLGSQLTESAGDHLLAWLSQSALDIPVIILFHYSEIAFVEKMMAAKAKGCVLKDITAAELITAIREVTNGKVHFSIRLKHIINAEIPQETSKWLHLTKRELETVQLIVKRRSSREISDQLFLSKRTIDTHRRNILKKFNVHTAAALIKALSTNTQY
ncbi:response regulator transcription factor [Niabella aurantiaca]|uniref:response regulator transcription factor n=1 Tax=Niabella aurantiaca TaxID=379900 RepID=UPI000360DF61|nr:response regulator transcription factor [Niabella aurantiaca]